MAAELDKMKAEVLTATTKVQTVKLSSQKAAVAAVASNHKRMKEMKTELSGFQSMMKVAAKRFASTKVNDTTNFETVMKNKYYVALKVAKDAAKLVRDTKAEMASYAEKNQEALEQSERIKATLKKEKYMYVSRQADEINARGDDKDFHKFKVKATAENIETLKEKLKTLKQTAEEAEEDRARTETTFKRLIKEELEKKKTVIQARDAKNEAFAEVLAQRKRSNKLSSAPLDVLNPLSEDAEAAAINNAKMKAEHKMEENMEESNVERALRLAAKTGKQSDLRKAEAEEKRMQNGDGPLPNIAPSSSACHHEEGKCEFKPRKCKANGAKCQGRDHGVAGGPGSLDCFLGDNTELKCLDSITSSGIFVPVAEPAVGFCAPWIPDHMHNATYDVEAAGQQDSVLEAAGLGGRTYIKGGEVKADGKLGSTYITKLGAFHPDGADKEVGVLVFKRIVCEENNCEEFKTARCIVCDYGIFDSKSTADSTVDENLNFLKTCAIPLLEKNGEIIPEESRCTDTNLVYAKRAVMAF